MSLKKQTDFVGPGKKPLSRPNQAVSNKRNRKGESISNKRKNEIRRPISSFLDPISQFSVHSNAY